jgi:hypothetical protein
MPSHSHSLKILSREVKFLLDSLANRVTLVECVSHEANWKKACVVKVYDIEVALVREDEVSLVKIRKTEAEADILFSEIDF